MAATWPPPTRESPACCQCASDVGTPSGLPHSAATSVANPSIRFSTGAGTRDPTAVAAALHRDLFDYSLRLTAEPRRQRRAPLATPIRSVAMTDSSRFAMAELDDVPDDIRERILEVQAKSGFVPNVFLMFARRPAEWRAFFAFSRRSDGTRGVVADPRRPRTDRHHHLRAERLPVLRCRARGAATHLREEPPYRGRGRGQPPHRRPLPASACDPRLRHQGQLGPGGQGDADFEDLAEHGLDKEDVWDVAAITALFGLSNRMATAAGMVPNPEFYLMGRVPRTT